MGKAHDTDDGFIRSRHARNAMASTVGRVNRGDGLSTHFAPLPDKGLTDGPPAFI
jgi:hypothetical protein